jgi:uncharacterized OB-fold protein
MSAKTKSVKKQVPAADNLFTWSSNDPRLIGARCRRCGEVFFPIQSVCSFCSSTETEEINFSRKGTLDLYTCVRYPTPGYNGPVPLCIGFVRLPEGTKVITPLAECNFEELRMGMEMEMIVQKVAIDEQGNDLLGFAFRPVKKIG